MQFTKLSIALFVLTLAVPGIQAFSQAHVTENQTTFIYVDGNSGSDGNPGTPSLPLRTIQAAVTVARLNNTKSIGTKVLINPGIYREAVNISSSYNQTSAPMTFQATQIGGAVIAGSDVLTNWTNTTGNSSIYTHPWTYNFGPCAVPSGWPSGFAGVVLRTEMIFVNGTPLTQVMSASDLRAGTFYVDEGANEIQIWPSSSTNMNSAVVEAAVRPQTLTMNGRTNVVFRGLVFRNAATCINQYGAVVNNSTNILFDQIQANWNNWGGIGINSSSQITVQNSVASHNGGVGFAGNTDRNTLFNSNESSYNNWRGAMGALYDWGMGGTKLMYMHGATVTNHSSYRNQAQGLWFDTDSKNISIDHATLSENVLAGLQIEVDEGPISLTSSKLCSSGIGLNIINSSNITASNNVFYSNSGTNRTQAQIYLAGKLGGRQAKDWETGQTYNIISSNLTLNGNTVQDAGPGQLVFGTFLTGSDWSTFETSLSSNHNSWYDPSLVKAFKLPNGKMVDLSGWQLETREDLASGWSSSSNSCAAPASSFQDFSVNSDNRNYTMSSGKAVITLRVNSFGSGAVTLAASGLPSGVSASFQSTNLVSGVSALTLTASSSASIQTVPITIYANSGNQVHSVSVSVAVHP
jgi:Right handed beta helix region